MGQNDRRDPAPMASPQRLLGGPISQSGPFDQPMIRA